MKLIKKFSTCEQSRQHVGRMKVISFFARGKCFMSAVLSAYTIIRVKLRFSGTLDTEMGLKLGVFGYRSINFE